MEIRRYYLEKVFTDDELKIISLHKQFHHIVIDLLEYKIRPFNSSNKNKQTLLKKNRVLFKLLFINKALDMINLPFIFQNHELKSFVNFCNIKEPSVLFSSTPCIGSKIFNYNQVVREFTDLENVKCICKEYRGFINDDCNHVVTGKVVFLHISDILECGSVLREFF